MQVLAGAIDELARGRRRTAAGISLLDGLVAYWPLTEAGGDRADVHGGHTLTDHGVGSDLGVDGVELAAKFSSNYLNAADSPALSMGAGVVYTVQAWIRLGGSMSVGNIIAKRAASNYEYFLRAEAQLPFLFMSASGVDIGVVGGATPIPLATWTLVTAWYDGANLSIAVNADAPSVAAGIGDTIDGGNELVFGAEGDSGVYGEYFDGRIARAALWKRVLTPEERAEIFAGAVYPF